MVFPILVINAGNISEQVYFEKNENNFSQ